MRRELTALGRMLRAGIRQRRPDLIVSGTSPPCLLVGATLLARRFRARSIHWAMDLYPELAVALGEIPAGTMSRCIGGLMRWCYRQTDRTLALDADMAAHLARLGARTECLRPWVFESVWERVKLLRSEDRNAESGTTPWTWIYSGNLGRAHEWETLLEAQALIEREDPEVRLLFQGGGPLWASAQERAVAMGLRRCEWRPYVAEEELPATLLASQCCVATQRLEAQGLLWPSKLGLLLTLPRPLLFVGPSGGAIAEELRHYPHARAIAPGAAAEVASTVLSWRRNPPAIHRAATVDAGADRRQALTRWRSLVRELA